MDASTGKNLGPLEEIVETLDTGANAFSAKWSTDSKEVIIIYRVDRHAPLKAVNYTIVDRRARCIKGPFDVTSEELIKGPARPFVRTCSQPKDIWHTSSPWLKNLTNHQLAAGRAFWPRIYAHKRLEFTSGDVRESFSLAVLGSALRRRVQRDQQRYRATPSSTAAHITP